MNFPEWIRHARHVRIPDQADETIKGCLSLEHPKSFFLFAGAGSGKTGSLVAALNFAREHLGARLMLEKRKIGVITYTNAAADEINRRCEQYPCFAISTIHSFAWELIHPFQHDIKVWLMQKLTEDIRELEGKSGRARDVELPRKRTRLANVHGVHRFTYSPTGLNGGRDSLNHGEVISLCADFLNRPLMQEIFVSRYPILFIDESQDTNKRLMDVFLNIQRAYSTRFMLGLFGDMMQRIYLDGKERLDESIGTDWATPSKKINYRSPKRIVGLINVIRSAADDHRQQERDGAAEGFVRVFIAPASGTDKSVFENHACQIMTQLTGDDLWVESQENVKTLTLEHKMAAARLGFEQLYNALDHSKKLRDRAFEKLTELDPRPQVRGIAFLTEILLPLVQANRENNPFGVAGILKKHSPLLQPQPPNETLDSNAECHQVKNTKRAAAELFGLWDNGADPRLDCILSSLAATGLLNVPDTLKQGMALNAASMTPNSAVSKESAAEHGEAEGGDPEERQKQQAAWAAFVQIPFSQIALFHQYIKGESPFDTHQGVKGLEFPRVMVILDDEAAGGNLFSYDKLFDAKALSATDKSNIRAGKDNSLTRTNRLFYVICSRAEQSLAIVIYSANPQQVRDILVEKCIFRSDELIVCGDNA